jgi:sucrose-6-phosphate hydrolase SacC (GH32 family)
MNRRSFLYMSLGAAATSPGGLLGQVTANPGPANNAAVQSSTSDQGDAFAKAMTAVERAIPLAQQDPDRPVYHFRPPANWVNDPNAPVFYKGWHHLFYQLDPFAPRPGNQHWGHARSRDLVNWEHLPIALWPSANFGERAIFSGGSALAGDGRPRIIYTSIGHPQPEQWLAFPTDEDLLKWEKYPGNPVLSQSVHRSGPIAQWRDPYLFREDGATYMVCGGAANTGRAQVQLYRAEKADLTSWVHLGHIFQSLDRDVRNFECPNLFPLDGKWVLIVSPNRSCEYWVGDLNIQAMKFEPSAHGIIDTGDAYASNIQTDSQGRTILWLWGRTNTPQEKAWNGVMAMPRILSIGTDGYLLQRPAPEFQTLRKSPIEFPALPLRKEASALEGIRTDCAEIEGVFTGEGTFGFEFRRSNAGDKGVVVSIETGLGGSYLSVGSRRAYLGSAELYRLRVFLDKRCIEVFVNDGVVALYNWFDAGPENLNIAVFGEVSNRPSGGFSRLPAPVPPRLESCRIWPMKAASFSLDRFQV